MSVGVGASGRRAIERGSLRTGGRRGLHMLLASCTERARRRCGPRMTMTLRSRWSESTAAFFDHPLHRLRLGYAAWLFGIFCYFLPAATWSPVSRFDLTRAIVEQRTLSIDAFA